MADLLVILEKKSVTPIPPPPPLSLPTGLGEPGESGIFGGGRKLSEIWAFKILKLLKRKEI